MMMMMMMMMMTKMKKLMIMNRSLIKSSYLLPFMAVQDIEKKLALNALTIVTEIGKPTLFITGTVNVNWPEIQSRLLKGQTAFDRPDVVTQVFRCRLTKFIENLKAGKYFGKKKLDYILYCIEYQWRGLPHFHMAVKLQDVQTDTEAESVAFIDEFIKAEMPKRENFPNMTDGEFNSYLNLVKKQMKHDC